MEDQTVKNPDKGGVQSVARIFELIEVLAAHPAGAPGTMVGSHPFMGTAE